MMSEQAVSSDKDGMRGMSVGGGRGSGGGAWAGFDSSHRPFLQQEDSRKSNRQEETQYGDYRYRVQHTCSAGDGGHASYTLVHSLILAPLLCRQSSSAQRIDAVQE